MATYSESEYYPKARQGHRVIVRDAPKFDLDAYIANYRGRTRYDRLFLIGISSTHLCHEALKATVSEAKRGKDVGRYENAVAALHEIAPDSPEAKLDTAWLDRVNKMVKTETDKLEQELKGYKNNLIKESIRMGYDDLGQHYHRIGDLPSSIRSYARMRDFCTTPSHIGIMCSRLINVSIDQSNYLAVQSNCQKLANLPPSPATADRISAKLSAAMGLAHLSASNYKEAARSFVSTNIGMLSANFSDPNDEDSYNEVITPNDIAVYGGLCALASMTRGELQAQVLENNSFRNYLELEPHIRRAISHFVSSQYSACLSILQAYQADYLLDLHLQRHISEIYSLVRSKAIVQYFIPFSRVTLSALASAFATSEQTIESELVAMIERGTLDARIDLVDRVLLANKEDTRRKVHDDALKTAKDYERTAHLRVLRMEILNAGLQVKSGKGQGGMGVLGMLGQEGGFGGGAGDPYMGGEGRRSLRSGRAYA